MALYDNWTYSVGPPPTITIVADDVKGGTEATKFNYQDVIDCNTLKGWGADVSVLCTKLYCLGVLLVIGNGTTTTYFGDSEVAVVWKDGVLTTATPYNSRSWIRRRNKGYIILGELFNATRKSTRRGVCFIDLEDGITHYPIYDEAGNTEGYTYLYSMLSNHRYVARFYLQGGSGGRIWNGTFVGSAGSVSLWVGKTDVFNIFVDGGFDAIRPMDALCTMDTIVVKDSYYIDLYGVTGPVIKNVLARQITTWQFDSRYPAYMINVDYDAWLTWNVTWITGGAEKTYRQYEFDLRVTDKDNNPLNGATITLKDKDGNTVFSATTDANGKITTQTVSRGYYQQSTGNTLNEYSPHTLTITRAGYQDYVKKFTLETKTSWEIKLAKAVGVFHSFGSPVVDLKKADPENKRVLAL